MVEPDPITVAATSFLLSLSPSTSFLLSLPSSLNPRTVGALLRRCPALRRYGARGVASPSIEELEEMAPEKGKKRVGSRQGKKSLWPRNASPSKGLNLDWVPEG